jgi:mRNA interferase RelE/StbE
LTYRVQIKASAVKAIGKLPKADQARVDERIASLATNPRPAGCVKLAGSSQLWRIRIGDWRLVYHLEDNPPSILVLTIAHRREVYRDL